MLGRLLMTVDECIAAYETLADGVFGHPRRFHIRRPPWIPRNKYNHRDLENIIKGIVEKNDHSGNPSALFRQPLPEMCRT